MGDSPEHSRNNVMSNCASNVMPTGSASLIGIV